MPSENKLQQLRREFKIPDSVLIVVGSRIAPGSLRASRIGDPPASGDYNIPQGDAADPHIYRSKLNTKVYTDLTFMSKQYTDSQGRVINTPQKTYYEILVQVSQVKRIQRTEIQGKDGSVKEYIGKDDYKIQLNGIITGANGIRPIDEISDLITILDAPVTIDVACEYLRSLGIDSVVVDEYDLGESEGSYSYQPFSISCSSDIPVQLRLNGL